MKRKTNNLFCFGRLLLQCAVTITVLVLMSIAVAGQAYGTSSRPVLEGTVCLTTLGRDGKPLDRSCTYPRNILVLASTPTASTQNRSLPFQKKPRKMESLNSSLMSQDTTV